MSKLALDFIAELRERRVELWLDNGNLKYRAPKGAIPESDFGKLRELREDIIRELAASTAGGRTRPASEAHTSFPQTDLQFAYLIGRRPTFAWGGVGCHGYLEFHHDRPLDVHRLEQAFETLIARHPALRTVFSPDGTQRVLARTPAFVVDHQRNDLRFDMLLKSRRDTMSHRLYDGTTWPLFAAAVSEGHGKSALHISFDLLVADFSGFALLLAELETLYREPATTLPALSYSFRDYMLDIAERRESQDRTAYETDKAWWLQRVDTLPPPPEFPLETDTAETPRFERIAMRIETSDWEKLQRRAAGYELTASATLLAAFCEVVGKWSRTEHFTIALPLLDRMPLHPDVENIVGDFTTVNLLEVDHDPTVDFLRRARGCQQQLWQDLDHRSFSGVEMAREMARRTGRKDVMFPIVFTSTIGQPMRRNGEWNFARARYGITQTPQVWLDCQAMLDGDALIVNWDTRAGTIRKDVIDAMSGSFVRLLHDLASSDSGWRSADPVALPASQVHSRTMSNSIDRAIKPMLLHAPIAMRCERAPHAIAVIENGQRITYAELIAAASSVCRRLQASGFAAGDRAAIVTRKSLEQVVGTLGVLLAGGCYVPVDAHQPPSRRDRILADSGVRCALVDSDADTEWPASIRRIALRHPEPAGVAALPENGESAAIDPSATAYVIYTSGSTGDPKGVVISHRAVNNTLRDLDERLNIGPEDAVLGLAHLGFDLSVFDIFGILGSGGRLVLPSSERLADPSHWVDLLRAHRITIWNTVPAQALMLAEYLEANRALCDGIRLRHIMLSGDWIPVDLPNRLSALLPCASVMSLGGATEAAIWSIFHPVVAEDAARSSIPYGTPLSNQRMYVLDRGLRERPDWVAGDLYIGGAGLADGYLGDDARTAAAFRIHPDKGIRVYRTGDIGRYDDQGVIELLGRSDLQVKILGHRIELLEIDAAAVAIPGVAAAAAVAIGERTDRRLALAVKPVPNATIDPAGVIAGLRSRLPDYMVPTIVRIVERLPQSGNAKVDRAAIVRMIEQLPREPVTDGGEAISIPSSELEATVAEVFQDAFGVTHIARDENFIDAGGNSLLAARIVAQIRQILPAAHAIGFDELLVTLLRERTIAGVSAAIARRESEIAGTSALLRIAGEPGQPGIATVALGFDADAAAALAAKLREALGGAGSQAISIGDDDAWAGVPEDMVIDRFADTAFESLTSPSAATGVVLAAEGAMSVAALETARRLRESGLQQVWVIAAGSTETHIPSFWQRAMDAFVPYPYLGDVALIGRPPLPGSDWEDVAMGRLEVFASETSIDEVVGELLQAAGKDD
ncbi:MAG: amino acid adenylation domain-containing protein [Pseudomonadota bacterium]